MSDRIVLGGRGNDVTADMAETDTRGIDGFIPNDPRPQK